jgi:hypothetical protein
MHLWKNVSPLIQMLQQRPKGTGDWSAHHIRRWPMQEKSLSGALYYLAIKDKASGFRQVFFLKKKPEVAGKFKIYIPSFQNETGKLIKTIRTDNGTEFKGQD